MIPEIYAGRYTAASIFRKIGTNAEDMSVSLSCVLLYLCCQKQVQ